MCQGNEYAIGDNYMRDGNEYATATNMLQRLMYDDRASTQSTRVTVNGAGSRDKSTHISDLISIDNVRWNVPWHLARESVDFVATLVRAAIRPTDCRYDQLGWFAAIDRPCPLMPVVHTRRYSCEPRLSRSPIRRPSPWSSPCQPRLHPPPTHISLDKRRFGTFPCRPHSN